MRINNIILEKRKEFGLTQLELAHKLGVTNRTVSRWEKGTSIPDIHSLKRLSEIFNVSMDTFYSTITVDPIIDEPIDTPMINKFMTLSVVSIGLLAISYILIIVSYFMSHRSNESIIFQVIGIVFSIISMMVFIISYVTFTVNYKSKKLQSDYKRLKTKFLIVFSIVFFICIILLLITINL